MTVQDRADALVGLWITLLRGWTGADSDDAPPTTFADDLRTRVKGQQLAGAERQRLAAIFDDERNDGLLPYAVGALQAVAAREYGLVNPHRARWASIYFEMEKALALRPGGPSPRSLALRLPPEEATGTIDYLTAWDVCRRLLEPLIHDRPYGTDLYVTVQRTAAGLGFPHLARAVVQASALGTRAADGEARPADRILDLVLTGRGGLEAALAGAHRLVEGQPADRRGELINEVAAGILAAHPDQPAAVSAWQARRHAADGRFDAAERILDAAGEAADAPVPVRARLLGARADVYTGRGLLDRAAVLWRRVADLVEDEPDRAQWYWARVNLALVVRDQGLAWDLLHDAAYGPGGFGADAHILGQLAVLAARRDDVDTAIDLLDQAVRLANDQPVVRRRLRAQRALLLLRRERDAEALAELLATTDPVGPERSTTVNEAVGWATLLKRGAVSPELTERVRALPAGLAEQAERALRSGDVAGHLDLLAAAADVRAEIDGAAALDGYEQLLITRGRHGSAPRPVELVQAARARHAAGDLTGMRDLLATALASMTGAYGATRDVAFVVLEPLVLLRPLADLAGALPIGEDLRLVGELQRDAIGRARTAYLRGPTGTAAAWRGEIAAPIRAVGPLTVVEWVRTGEKTVTCLLTRIAGGTAGTISIDPGTADPIQVQAELTTRLADGGADAFDVPGWQNLAGHLLDALDTHAGPDDHVVLLHQASWTNLPWHTAIRGRWTVSYAAGWTHLAAFLDRPPAPRDRLGLLLVPLAGDSPQVVGVLRAAHQRLAAEPAARVVTQEPAQADQAFLTELFADSDVAVLLCHGWADRTGDVSLVLAAGGNLPSSLITALRRNGNLLGWPDVLRLPAAPRTVLSAACSSAVGVGAGLGDRLSLGFALRTAGTTTLAAPSWDVRAADIVPVLTEATRSYLAGTSLAEAIRTAARAAGPSGGPDVWSLAIEGDFR